jgi:hypothetical protein
MDGEKSMANQEPYDILGLAIVDWRRAYQHLTIRIPHHVRDR